MRIAGLHRSSLIDYPDHLSCVVFMRGCNLRCPYCHNGSILENVPSTAEDMPLGSFWDFLKSRKGLLDGVCVSGGEPTLQPNLEAFLVRIRENGFKVKLDTNGTSPWIIERLLGLGLLDYVALDVKAPPDRYVELGGGARSGERVFQTARVLMDSDVDYEFRTTVVPGLHCEADLREIGEALEGAKRCFIQNFRPDNALQSNLRERVPFTGVRLEAFKVALEPFVGSVGIRL